MYAFSHVMRSTNLHKFVSKFLWTCEFIQKSHWRILNFLVDSIENRNHSKSDTHFYRLFWSNFEPIFQHLNRHHCLEMRNFLNRHISAHRLSKTNIKQFIFGLIRSIIIFSNCANLRDKNARWFVCLVLLLLAHWNTLYEKSCVIMALFEINYKNLNCIISNGLATMSSVAAGRPTLFSLPPTALYSTFNVHAFIHSCIHSLNLIDGSRW